MRIVGGTLKGRRIAAPPGLGVRPTADRARQMLFDLLAHGNALAGFALAGRTVLDAFAGSGALALEALSRGAARATLLETDRGALATLRANIAALGLEERARVLARDATHPGRAPEACGLAFLDPPYGSGLAAPALEALAAGGWLEANAVAVVEHAAAEPFAAPAGFALLESRGAGAGAFTLLRRG